MNAHLLNPPTLVTEPRKRASAKLPLLWYALYNGSGAITSYVQRRTESEAMEALALDPLVAYEGGGRVKRVVKPARGYVNGQLLRLKAKRKALDREIALWEGLL